MKEARIIMPITPNLSAHVTMQRSLLDTFGGYTLTQGLGAWKDESGTLVKDQVMIYDIACDENRDRVYDQLFEIAMKAGRALGQKAVYIRYPAGKVEIADCDQMFAGRAQPYKREHTPAEIAGTIQPPAHEPLGTKRTPEVGDVWKTHSGATVAVLDVATRLDGGFKVVILSAGETHHKLADLYTVDFDGRFIMMREHYNHPLDLVSFVTKF